MRMSTNGQVTHLIKKLEVSPIGENSNSECFEKGRSDLVIKMIVDQ